MDDESDDSLSGGSASGSLHDGGGISDLAAYRRNRMKAELLRILRESESYVSGQQLCEHFGVSRTAVWKVIRQLKEEGYEICGGSKNG